MSGYSLKKTQYRKDTGLVYVDMMLTCFGFYTEASISFTISATEIRPPPDKYQ